MDFVTILLVAVGLALDAFAVSVGIGISRERVSARQSARLGFHFGFFQFMMPVLGWLAGRSISGWIGGIDHWVAFGLLAIIGLKMIREAFRREGARKPGDPTRGVTLIILSVATSIDALAVGLSLAFINVPILYPSVIIGIVAAGLTVVGMNLGKAVGSRFSHGVEILGGLILIGIGVKILLEHIS
jgi:putative Mn2+ efflux pump MntP